MREFGRFIAIEGGEGAGKTSTIKALKPLFSHAIFVAEPGGTEIGNKVRSMLGDLASLNGISPWTLTYLFAAARAQLIHEVIRPALNRGALVIADRFIGSSMAYQGCAHPDAIGPHAVVSTQLDMLSAANCIPDAVIVLDIDPEIGLKRAASRGGSIKVFEEADLEFHRKVRAFYYLGGMAGAFPGRPTFHIIDASSEQAAVLREVQEVISMVDSSSTQG